MPTINIYVWVSKVFVTTYFVLFCLTCFVTCILMLVGFGGRCRDLDFLKSPHQTALIYYATFFENETICCKNQGHNARK